MLLKLLLAGDGGQGIQTMAEIICQAAFEKGWQVTHIPNYGLEQRGGVSLSFIQISDLSISYPKFTRPDILLVMSKQAQERTKQQQNSGSKILNLENYSLDLKENNILPQNYNVFFLGVLSKIFEKKEIITKEDVFNLIEEKLSKKFNWEENKKAFEIGYQY